MEALNRNFEVRVSVRTSERIDRWYALTGPHIRCSFAQGVKTAARIPRQQCGLGGWPGPHLFLREAPDYILLAARRPPGSLAAATTSDSASGAIVMRTGSRPRSSPSAS